MFVNSYIVNVFHLLRHIHVCKNSFIFPIYRVGCMNLLKIVNIYLMIRIRDALKCFQVFSTLLQNFVYYVWKSCM